MAYHPPQRAVGAFVFSLDRWIRGTFHLPKLHAFEEHLARRRTCRIVPPLPGRAEPVPVVFVNAGALLAVAEEGGSVGERPIETPAETPVPAR